MYNRRTATKVKGGRVQRKNRQRPTAHERLVLHREAPGHGFRHVVSKRDVVEFVELIPDWPRLSERLEAIRLIPSLNSCDGYHEFFDREETGVIALCAWPNDLWVWLTSEYFKAHAGIFRKLGVCFEAEKDDVHCRFTEDQARAFTLLHVFMHELGHHYDRINQKHWGVTKGEDYAEKFANQRFSQLHPAYVRAFGDPSWEQS